jgi:hypothetical protein
MSGRTVKLRAAEADMKAWEAAAKANGLSLSEYIRRKLNNKPIKAQKQAPGEEYRHGGLTPQEWEEVWRLERETPGKFITEGNRDARRPVPPLRELGIFSDEELAAFGSLPPGADPDSEQEIRKQAADKAAQELCEKTGIIL